MGDEEYIVEKIVGRRINRGKMEYCLKWKNYPSTQNTWEPEEHLNCPELIANYLKSLNDEKKKPIKRGPKKNAKKPKKEKIVNTIKTEATPELRLEDTKNLTVERIVSVLDKNGNGDLQVCLKWENVPGIEWVSINFVHNTYPQLLIDYYENHIVWDGDEPGDESD